MSVTVDSEFWWNVPIKSRTPTEIVFDVEVSGTVAGIPATVQYTYGRIENGSFSWDQLPLTLSGSAHHPAGTLRNVCV